MTPFESAARGSLEGSHGGRVPVRDDHGTTALHHYAGLNSAGGFWIAAHRRTGSQRYAAEPAAATAAAPDVGSPTEGADTEHLPSISPDGSKVVRSPATTAAEFTAQGWIETYAIADGARVRTQPVTGTPVGTIPKGAYFWVSCKRQAGDGYAWGWSSYNGRTGWVRGDLWEVVQHTAPGGGGTPTVP